MEEEEKKPSSSNPVYSEDDVVKAMEVKKAEIEAKAKEEANEEKEAEFSTEREGLIKEKEDKEEELEKTKKEIEGLRSKDLSFKILREKASKAESIQNEVDKLKKDIEGLKEEPIKAMKEEFVNSNVGENEEDIKVYNYHYSRLSLGAIDKESAKKAMKEALLLFQQDKGLLDFNPFRRVLGTHGRPAGIGEGLTAMQKEIFNDFGVTEEMIKKVNK